MACERYLNSIQEAVDGTLGSIRRAELEVHLDQCEGCRALHDDLQRIHAAAADLPELPAPDGAWPRIAGRLRQEGRVHGAIVPRGYMPWLAAAAAVMLAVVSAAMLLRPGKSPESAGNSEVARSADPKSNNPAGPAAGQAGGTGNAAAAPGDDKAVESAQQAVDAAQQQFEKAIGDLEKVVVANRQALDPGTSQTIEKSLGILDQAIADNRSAVKAEPASVAARETLFQALRQKVTLLQDTIAVINEMRKGNNAAAAQLVNKS